jgi:hypothetical protein
VDSVVAVASLDGWTPIRVHGTAAEPLVDWAVIDAPFTDPFFEQSVHRAMQHPFNQVFRRTTPLGVLDAFPQTPPGGEPAGFVFHMSRCGSTLIAQMLSRLSDTIVLSEPQPLDGVLRLRRAGALDDESAVRRLRAMAGAMSTSRRGERRFFVKFHAWHAVELPLITRAFPATPWVFAFREPRAVMRSQEKNPGAEVVPLTLDPRIAGVEPNAIAAISPAEYCARMLAAFCDASIANAGLGRMRFMEYADLPGAVFTDVLPLFGVTPDAEETRRMLEIATVDAKSDGNAFHSEAPAKPSAEIDRLAEHWLDPLYAAMRDFRPLTG